MKVIAFGVATFIVAAAIFAAGVYFGHRFARQQVDLAALVAAAERGRHAFKQYRTADAATAERALLDYIAFADGLGTLGPAMLDDQVRASDRILTYVRVAVLRERGGDLQGATTFMTKARESCTKAGRRNCSEVELRAMVETLDKEIPAS